MKMWPTLNLLGHPLLHLSTQYCRTTRVAGGDVFVHNDVLRLKLADSTGGLLASDESSPFADPPQARFSKINHKAN